MVTVSVPTTWKTLRIALIVLVVYIHVIANIICLYPVYYDSAAERTIGIADGNDSHRSLLQAQPEEEPSSFIIHNNHVSSPGQATAASRNRTGLIPRTLIFTYKTNLLRSSSPGHLHENVRNTIQVYADAWGIKRSEMNIHFYTDAGCRSLLQQAEPKLLPFFDTENFGPFKGDMCRIAALYLHGGYYLDVDIQPLKALDPPPDIDFITAKMPQGRLFFQAVMAFQARHPILKGALESMLIDWYMIPSVMREHKKTEFALDFFKSKEYEKGKLKHLKSFNLGYTRSVLSLMGPVTLYLAFDRQRDIKNPWVLEEIENEKRNLYPELIREANGWGCNHIVHDAAGKTPYFYSRCRGTMLCPPVISRRKKGTNFVNNEIALSSSIQEATSHNHTGLIPRTLIFTYKANLLRFRRPVYLFQNVKNTIQVYADAWGIKRSEMNIHFYTNSGCRDLLERAEPKLLPVFDGEDSGAYKGDMCRIAALYLHGGYYFDVDIQPLRALDPPPDVDFITAQMPDANMFFQAVMAFPARHPILKGALESMLIDWYMIPSVTTQHNKTEFELDFYRSKEYEEGKLKHLKSLNLVEDPLKLLLGPVTLYLAFDRQRHTTNPWILEEIANDERRLYPEVIRVITGWGCNYVVHDAAGKIPYFYSRCRGTSGCPLEGEKAMLTRK